MRNADRISYTYSVLRYVHDVVTGEFINVGIVAATQEPFRLTARFRTTFGRVKDAFPTLDSEIFRQRMRALQHRFDSLAEGDIASASLHSRSLADVLASVLPPDDSSLQWSPLSSGVTRDLESAVLSRFNRMVTAHDHGSAERRRKDDDVWKLFRTELEVRNVLGRLQKKDIQVADDAVHFEHAWKNGLWNCLEPISFDLSNADLIKEKAHRWLGQLESVKEAQDSFEVHFLVGRPSSPDLRPAYEQAKSILRKASVAHIVEEEEAVAFSESLASEMQKHDAQQRLQK